MLEDDPQRDHAAHGLRDEVDRPVDHAQREPDEILEAVHVGRGRHIAEPGPVEEHLVPGRWQQAFQGLPESMIATGAGAEHHAHAGSLRPDHALVESNRVMQTIR